MILEVTILNVKPGEEKKFERDFTLAAKDINSIEGYLGHSLSRCTEQPSKYILQINWQVADEPDKKFRTSEQYIILKDMLYPYYTVPPAMEHYSTVFEFRK